VRDIAGRVMEMFCMVIASRREEAVTKHWHVLLDDETSLVCWAFMALVILGSISVGKEC